MVYYNELHTENTANAHKQELGNLRELMGEIPECSRIPDVLYEQGGSHKRLPAEQFD